MVCALVPLIERATRRMPAATPTARSRGAPTLPWRDIARGVRKPVVAAAVIVAVAAPINTAALAGDEQVLLIEKGLAGKNAQ